MQKMSRKSIFVFIFLGLILILLIPNISNAATAEQTYKDEKQGIEWSYQVDDGNNVIKLKCKTTSKIGKVEIPEKIDEKPVVSLDGKNGTFKDCAGITEVIIPNTVTIIGDHAFAECTGLKSIVIPNSVTKIEDYAFYNCSGLNTITFSENLTSIGHSVFYNCTGLKSITIPDSVTKIETYAFYNCSGIKEITLSKNLSKIADGTFENCTGLTSVILPDSVTTLEGAYTYIDGAFGNCKSLQKILIPDSVVSIGNGAFRNCEKLTIYGNDGMASKEYAEEHKIPFEYIANWDKASSGSDVTAPTVTNMQVTYDSVKNYDKDANKNMYMVPAQAKLVINVTFSEVVEGSTVPTLTIKFGTGKNIQVTEGTIGGSKITYIYTVKSTDKGVMTAVDYKGGNIKDAAGNAVILSCPALNIQYSSGDFVYANGTATNPSNNGNNSSTSSGGANNGSSSNGGTTSGSSNNGGTTSGNNNNSNTNGSVQGVSKDKNNTSNKKPSTSSSSSSSKNKTTGKKDNTVSPTILPQTGLGRGIMVIVIIATVYGIYAYRKYNYLKDIK